MVGTALQVGVPQIDAVGAMSKGINDRQVMDANTLKNYEHNMQLIGAGAMYALNGDLNGQADPAKYAEVLQGMTEMGLPVPEHFKNNPAMANVAARASMTALQQLQMALQERNADLQARQLEQTIRQFEHNLTKPIEMGNRLVDPRTYEVLKDFTPPQLDERYNPETGQLEKVVWDGVHPESAEPFGGQKAPSGMIGTTNPETGETVWTPGPGKGGFNVDQAKNAGFADRMVAANAIISDEKLQAAQMDAGKIGWSKVPVLGNAMVGTEYQQADQARRDFINAVLRRESGAVISDSEFDNANKQYFPQPFDGPEVLKQKAANRKTAIEGVIRAAGPNYVGGAGGAPAAPGAPAVGTIDDGYRFLGGDPNDPANWEAVQ